MIGKLIVKKINFVCQNFNKQKETKFAQYETSKTREIKRVPKVYKKVLKYMEFLMDHKKEICIIDF